MAGATSRSSGTKTTSATAANKRLRTGTNVTIETQSFSKTSERTIFTNPMMMTKDISVGKTTEGEDVPPCTPEKKSSSGGGEEDSSEHIDDHNESRGSLASSHGASTANEENKSSSEFHVEKRSNNKTQSSSCSSSRVSPKSSGNGSVRSCSKISVASSKGAASYFSVGREFYDDGYSDASEESIQDKLDFNSPNVKVLARKNELRILHDVYGHVVKDSDSKNSSSPKNAGGKNKKNKKKQQKQPLPDQQKKEQRVVMIQGLSGTGKSTLVKKFITELNSGRRSTSHDQNSHSNKNGDASCGDSDQPVASEASSQTRLPKPIFLSGKYEELSGIDVPFSAIVEAFSGLAISLLQEDAMSVCEPEASTVNKDLARIQKAIHDALGSDLSALTDVIPNLKPIIEGNNGHESFNDSTNMNNGESSGEMKVQENNNNRENAWNRLKYVFQKFSNAISSKERPVIMFLDDLQWCDPASLDLIQALLTDKNLHHFMFIGAYRSDEVHGDVQGQEDCHDNNVDGSGGDLETPLMDDISDIDGTEYDNLQPNKGGKHHHPLEEILEEIENVQTIHNIALKNLSLEEMEDFVSDVLKCGNGMLNQDEETDPDYKPQTNNADGEEEGQGILTPELKELSQIVHRKTKGNLFFAMQIMEELHKKGVLQFSRLTFQWEWHGDAKNLDELLVDDVVTAFSLKICSSPVLLQNALVTAAYARSTLDCHTLKKLMEMDGETSMDLEELMKALDKAVVDGLLSNTMGSTNYSFGHDRIQQAAYSLIPEGEPRNDFRAVIGARLYQLGRSSDGEDWMLFAAADHLNAAVHPKGEEDIMASINLNLEVGERASAISAHAAATKFLGFAMQSLMLLEGDPWVKHYEITLKVYRLIAEGELNQGRFDIGRGIADQIMKKCESLDDRLPTQLAFAKALGRENLHVESMRVGKNTLRGMKQYPKSNIVLGLNVPKDLVIVKRYFKNHSDDDIVALPLMTDKRMEIAMEFMSSVAYNSFYCGRMVQYLAVVLKMLRTTFKFGLCGQSGVAFTGFSLFSNNINDMVSAYRFFGVARRILEKTKAKHLEGLQLFVFAHWVGAWKNPDDDILAIYQQATRSSMESGDFENGMLSTTAGLHHAYTFCHELKDLDANYLNLMEQLNTYKVDSVQRMTIEQWLPIQYLRGTASSPVVDCEELGKFGPIGDVEGDDESYRLLYGYLGRIQLGFYFGHFDFALDMLNRLAKIPDTDQAYCTVTLRRFFAALVYCHFGQVTEKKSWYKKANAVCLELRNLCKIKGLNSWHRYLLADAHIRCTGGKSSSKAQASYDHAIAAAVKNGHIQDAGLAAQLAGEHFARMETGIFSKVMEQARDRLCRNYFSQARDYYRRWGAITLVKHLEKLHGKYFSFFIGKSLEQEQTGKGDAGSLAPTMNSVRMSFADDDDDDDLDSFCDLPRILSAPSSNTKTDDVSVISDFSAWRDSREYSNPHTATGNFPAMVEEEEGDLPGW